MQMKFKNGKIRIMQVSDPQDLQFIRPTMVRMLNTAYDKYNPDLILLTGDNILGNHLCDARIGTRLAIKDKAGEYEAMRVAIDKLICHIESRKIPFAMIYGNHDDRNSFIKEEQADILTEMDNANGAATVLKMHLGENSYPIIIGKGLIGSADEYFKLDRKAFIVTDDGVPTEYADTVRSL